MSGDILPPVHVIGGGLAGSEAAWQLARAGVAAEADEEIPVFRDPDRTALEPDPGVRLGDAVDQAALGERAVEAEPAGSGGIGRRRQ